MVDAGRRIPEIWRSIFNVENTDRYIVERRSIAGIGLMQKIETDIPPTWPYQDLINRFPKTYTQVWYGTGMQFSKPFIKWEMDDLGAQRGVQLVKAAKATMEFYCADQLINKFSTAAAYVCPDAAALASDSHPLYDNQIGGAVTYDNKIDATLDHDTLVDAMVMMDMTPDDRGFPEMRTATRLVVHPTLGPLASEILNSIQRSDTPDNAINVLNRDYNLRIVPWHYYLSTSQWDVLSNDHELNVLVGQAIESRATTDFDDESIKAKVDAMWAVGNNGWRGFIGGND
jgi:hypothetical protein